MTLKNSILSTVRRTKKGFTVGEIYDRLLQKSLKNDTSEPVYSSVRARVYELASEGHLVNVGVRKDKTTGRDAAVFML